MNAMTDAWDNFERQQSERLHELSCLIEEIADRRSAEREGDDALGFQLAADQHAATVEMIGIPARTMQDLRLKVRLLNRLADVQLGGWRDDIDERLVRSIAIDVESLPD